MTWGRAVAVTLLLAPVVVLGACATAPGTVDQGTAQVEEQAALAVAEPQDTGPAEESMGTLVAGEEAGCAAAGRAPPTSTRSPGRSRPTELSGPESAAAQSTGSGTAWGRRCTRTASWWARVASATR